MYVETDRGRIAEGVAEQSRVEEVMHRAPELVFGGAVFGSVRDAAGRRPPVAVAVQVDEAAVGPEHGFRIGENVRGAGSEVVSSRSAVNARA